MYIMNAWYVAAWATELSERPMARRICDVPLVLFRTVEGQATALFDRCPHRAAPLSLGKVTDQGLECGYHGLVIDPKGACVHIPGQKRIPASATVRSFPVVEKDAMIWIWMGEVAAADPALIVDYPFHNDTKNWPHKHATMHLKGNYLLAVDNLMDLTHVAYVHEKTIGGQADTHVEAQMETVRTPRGLKFSRWLLNVDSPPTTKQMVSFKGKVDRWQEFEFIAPCVIKQYSGSVDANTGAYDKDHREGGFHIRIFHGLTPETETTCFYFYSFANGFEQDDPATTERVFTLSDMVFAEDKVIIEGQQERLTEFGEGSLIDIRADSARVIMRRTINKMMMSETAQSNDTIASITEAATG